MPLYMPPKELLLEKARKIESGELEDIILVVLDKNCPFCRSKTLGKAIDKAFREVENVMVVHCGYKNQPEICEVVPTSPAVIEVKKVNNKYRARILALGYKDTLEKVLEITDIHKGEQK